jgi:hypothetical protein
MKKSRTAIGNDDEYHPNRHLASRGLDWRWPWHPENPGFLKTHKSRRIAGVMSLFDEIQDEILSSVPLSTVLRKAKVLAYRLKNQEFKDWVEHELNGYDDQSSLPEYREISTHSLGNFINSGWKMTDVPIPTNNIPRELRETVNEVHLVQGIKQLESHLDTLGQSKQDTLAIQWPANLLPLLNERVLATMNCIGAWRVISKGQITGIIENTRNRLLTFILELAELYPDDAAAGFSAAGKNIPDEQIRQVFNYYIMGGAHNILSSGSAISQGGTMAIFDQRNQNVNYQYNAAGDINFDSVRNRAQLIGQLEKLKDELAKAGSAGAIDPEVVTDAGYQITKAIQQSQRPEPNKKTMLDHINSAKTLIHGAASAAGIVAALAKAAELASHFF